MGRFLDRIGVIPRWLLAAIAVTVAVTLVLMAAPALAGPPIAPEATATPPATPSPVRRILFSGCPPDPQLSDPTRCYDWAIYEINSDGTGLRKLSQSRDDPPGRFALSPDGRHLLFSAMAQGPVPANDQGTELDAYKFLKAFLLDLTTLKESALPDDTAACQWATDERAVCRITAKDDADRGLYQVDLETYSRQKILTGLGAVIQAFSVSPDGRQVLLATQSLTSDYPQDATIMVTRVRVTGTERINLLTIPGRPSDNPPDVNWSPSGRWAAIQADARYGFASFWIADTQKWGLLKVAELSGIANILRWTSDERELLAYTCDAARGNSFGRIVAAKRDGTGVRTLADLQEAEHTMPKTCVKGRLSSDQISFLFWIPWWNETDQWGLFVTDGPLSRFKKILSGYLVMDALWLPSSSPS